MESAVLGRGHSVAASRLQAQRSIAGAASEKMGGLSALFFLRDLLKRIDEDWEGVQSDLETIRACLLHDDGILVNMTGDEKTLTAADGYVKDMLSAFPSKDRVLTPWTASFSLENEAITVPTQVNYVGKAAN